MAQLAAAAGALVQEQEQEEWHQPQDSTDEEATSAGWLLIVLGWMCFLIIAKVWAAHNFWY